MRGHNRWAVLALFLVILAAPVAGAANRPVEVRAQLENLAVPGPVDVTVREAVYQARVDEAAPGAAPTLTIDGGVVTAIQYWRNATQVRDPVAGSNIYEVRDWLQSDDVDFSPQTIVLSAPLDAPDVRVRMSGPHGVRASAAQELAVNTTMGLDALGQPRSVTMSESEHLDAFERVPENSGWFAYRPTVIEGGGSVGFLFDGWRVLLSGDGQERAVDTGVSYHEHHDVGEGGHVLEVCSFLVVWVHGGEVRFSPGFGTLEGFTPSLQTQWSGVASLNVIRGTVAVGSATSAVNQDTLELVGDFNADLLFGPDMALSGAEFAAVGNGAPSGFAGLSSPGTISVPSDLGIWTGVTFGLGLIGLLGIRTFRPGRLAVPPVPAPAHEAAPKPEAPAPGPESLTLDGLIERVRAQPLDGEAQFHLGIQLMQRGEPDVALRHLDRSFRLHPGSIMRILEDPNYAPIRDQHRVRQLLGRIQRETQQRLWAGYA